MAVVFSNDGLDERFASEVRTLNPNVNVPDLPQQYQGLLDANPYMNLDYKQSGWQKFLSALGFRTGYDKRVEDLQLQANEWNANVAAMARQEQYDSASSAAARMRSAGLNPDLTGIANAGESSSMPEDTNPPAPTETDSQSVGQFANVLMSGLTMAMGLSKDLMSLGQMRNAIDMGNIDKAKSMTDFAMSAILSGTGYNPVVEDAEHGDYLESGWQDKAAEAAYAAYSSNFGRRDQKRFRSAIDVAKKSLPVNLEQYKMLRDRVGAREDFWKSFESNTYSEFDSVISVVYQELGSLNEDIAKLSKSNEFAGEQVKDSTLQNELEYQDAVDPTQAAEAFNEGNIASAAESQEAAQNAKIQKAVRNTYARIVSKLEKLANSNEKGHQAASIALLAFQVISMMSVSGRTGSAAGFGAKGPFGASSSGMSIGF